MDIEIKKLTPELAEDYLHFFDVTPHSTGKEEHRCYCVCWCSDSCEKRDYSTAQQRRRIAGEYVLSGKIQGYLAYQGERVVGWCNANTKADCYECLSWKMFMDAVERDGKRVKSVFCFAIPPEDRRKGIAGLLLDRVCADAKEEGFDLVESYPNAEFIDTEQDFMGPVKLFEKHGFTACYRVDQRLVMRKYLD